MKLFFTVLVIILVIAAYVQPGYARGRSSNGGAGKNKNNVGGYAQKTCKTDACFKKHPGGKYTIPLQKKNNS